MANEQPGEPVPEQPALEQPVTVEAPKQEAAVVNGLENPAATEQPAAPQTIAQPAAPSQPVAEPAFAVPQEAPVASTITKETLDTYVYRLPLKGVVPDEIVEALDQEILAIKKQNTA